MRDENADFKGNSIIINKAKSFKMALPSKGSFRKARSSSKPSMKLPVIVEFWG